MEDTLWVGDLDKNATVEWTLATPSAFAWILVWALIGTLQVDLGCGPAPVASKRPGDGKEEGKD